MSCVTTNIPLTICEGGTFNQSFQWKTGTPPVAVSISGYTAKMDIRTKITSLTTLLTLEDQTGWIEDGVSGIYMDDSADGIYQIYINDEDTLGLCANHVNITGVYDLFLYSPAGESLFKQYGICNIIASVTR